jgi:hypothetical protein
VSLHRMKMFGEDSRVSIIAAPCAPVNGVGPEN